MRIITCTTAKEDWDKLEAEFRGDDRSKNMQIRSLRMEFESIHMKETESMKEFLGRLMKNVSQIRVLGETLEDRRAVEKVLVGLPRRFETKICSIEDSKDITKISVNEPMNSLQIAEQRHKLRDDDTPKSALFAQSKGKARVKERKQEESPARRTDKQQQGNSSIGKEKRVPFPPCPHCNRATHAANLCWFRPNVQCRNCKKMGHMQRVCKKAAHQAQIAQVAEQHEELFVATHVDSALAVHRSTNLWLIDSGCSNHMSPNLDIFKSLDKSCTSMLIHREEGLLWFKQSQLVDTSFRLLFDDVKCIVKDCNGSLLIIVELRNINFPLYIGESSHSAFASVVDQTSLMHRRLGHCSYFTLREITRHHLVDGMPSVTAQDCICSVCEAGKSSRASFGHD